MSVEYQTLYDITKIQKMKKKKWFKVKVLWMIEIGGEK